MKVQQILSVNALLYMKLLSTVCQKLFFNNLRFAVILSMEIDLFQVCEVLADIIEYVIKNLRN